MNHKQFLCFFFCFFLVVVVMTGKHSAFSRSKKKTNPVHWWHWCAQLGKRLFSCNLSQWGRWGRTQRGRRRQGGEGGGGGWQDQGGGSREGGGGEEAQNLSRVTTASLWPQRDVDICILPCSPRVSAPIAETSFYSCLLLRLEWRYIHLGALTGRNRRKRSRGKKKKKKSTTQIISLREDNSFRSVPSVRSN